MNTTTIQTQRGAAGDIETSAMANCLMLLSAHSAAVSSFTGVVGNAEQQVAGRMFTCKTCDRKFPSFQALGGHRASHKKAKSPNSVDFPDESGLPAKQKIHSCKFCGIEFSTGQALGGHMRRHRENIVVVGGGGVVSAAVSGVTTEGSSGSSESNDGGKKRKMSDDVSEVPILKKSSSSKRVCLDLELDLALWKKVEAEKMVAVAKYADDDYEIEHGEIVEQHHEQAAAASGVEDVSGVEDEEKDFLKLELRQPINCW
ncbi:hypothetical protein SOVF_130370 [Spinacia oleracea]|uniref:Zinc finger protein ZAT12 n=1 Tax=Spinacia oleracea TaxID=3562 RepID=A0A9R0JC93_SPIOL|nr:zinc finger protein ZAT12 [Spinacia oleracea]KNA11901.1 hypothetical protein SOVF_130370 [Spinacia oleracea]